MVPQNNNIVKCVLLLILAISGNFVAEILSCKTQLLLNNNMLAKHFIGFCILYFAIGFSSTDSPSHPLTMFKISFVIYLLFILFSKMNITFTIIVFLLIMFSYVIYTYINYYQHISPKETALISKLKKTQYLIHVLIILLILIGFSLYFSEQHKIHYNKWSTVKFIFGNKDCDSMKK